MAAVDGSIDRNSEIIGASDMVSLGQQPEENISFPVCGPLASFCAEAAGLDRLLDLVAQDRPLLISTDCVTMLKICSSGIDLISGRTQKILRISMSFVRACENFNIGPGALT